MDHHFVGKDRNFEGGRGAAASSPSGTSLAVRQFVAFARGTQEPHSPSQPWRVRLLIVVKNYCLDCKGERTFDVFVGDGSQKWAVCRCCGNEVMHG